MGAEINVRPMTEQDVDSAWDVAWAALLTSLPAEFDTGDDAITVSGRRRVTHLLDTDPGGAWIAEDSEGRVAGVALALIREDVWGFSLFGVRPELHGQRIGSRLYEAALAYGDGTRGGVILSTGSPAAMRQYARSGFQLRPTVCLAGALNASRIPGGLLARPGDPTEDRDTIDIASRHVRGATHARDVPAMLDDATKLLVLEGRGFAVHHDGTPYLLAAVDEDAAMDLLCSCFAQATPGTTARIDFITAGNDWAINAGLAAGLTLNAYEGPTFVRGDVGPWTPYLPSYAYL